MRAINWSVNWETEEYVADRDLIITVIQLTIWCLRCWNVLHRPSLYSLLISVDVGGMSFTSLESSRSPQRRAKKIPKVINIFFEQFSKYRQIYLLVIFSS